MAAFNHLLHNPTVRRLGRLNPPHLILSVATCRFASQPTQPEPSGALLETKKPVNLAVKVYPKQKEAEFDGEGRPLHPFYFTTKPNYSQALFDVVEVLEKLMLLNDQLQSQGIYPDRELLLNDVALSGTRWMAKDEFEKSFLESLSTDQYDELISALDRITFQHFSYKVKDFIFKYRVSSGLIQSKVEILPVLTDEKGRSYVEAQGQKKSACAKVRVTKPGTGKFTLMNIDFPEEVQGITYFFGMKERLAIMFPLQFTKLLGQVDVEAVVNFGGSASQASAIRYATAMCLRSFVDEGMVARMAVAGLLTQDVRVRERKKPGQEGARRKYSWNKR
eukprot:TCALIF_03533-PA protein Name:"Similar to MRPS9 28S ribosomal protein S9, mitochondrial (Homo sapiens)" AED:0.14 eAED:0.14 QI:225/0.5/1/1/1/1/3/50/333